jgi:glycosyltransferase involved in cell wall biosynthesis
LFIGRFERRKGVEELNEALRRFSSAQPLQFSFIGPIPPSAKLPGLHYHGQITEAREMQSIIDECHVLVLPSHSEGMPNVIVEAMSRGLAIAATDVGAIDVQIDTQCGWLMKPGSFQSILQTMEEITNSSEEEIHHKRVAARDRVKSRFLWPGIAQRTGSEIEQFIRRIG